MSDFLNSISSPSWWVSVVVIGILVNLASDYLKPKIDNWFSSYSRKRATATTQKRDVFLKQVELVRNSKHEQIMIAFELLRNLIVGLVFIITSLIIIVTGIVIQDSVSPSNFYGSSPVVGLYILSAITFFYGMQKITQDNSYNILNEAKKPQGSNDNKNKLTKHDGS